MPVILNNQDITAANPIPVSAALIAGSALAGKVGIDQTTPGTTNKVVASVASGGIASGAVASGAIASGAVAAGAIAAGAVVSGAVLAGALATGAIVDLGTTITDAAATNAVEDTTAKTGIGLFKGIKNLLKLINDKLVTGTVIGNVGIDQTTPGTTNKVVASMIARVPILDSGTGAAAIAKSSAAHTTAFLLHWVMVHFNAAPTTSENLTVIRNSVTAAAYDTVLCKVNPSVGALTDIVYMPDHPLLCKAGDVIDVAFTNTDTKTYGVEICTEDV